MRGHSAHHVTELNMCANLAQLISKAAVLLVMRIFELPRYVTYYLKIVA